MKHKHYTPSSSVRGPKYKIKKSVFIATIYSIQDNLGLVEKIKSVREEFSKASHNAYAFRLMEDGVERSDLSDDGEVKGTAGRVILQHLENMNVMNVLLVVTRFYGGINLGKGGLIRAYSKTAKDLLDNIELIEFIS